MTYLDFVEEAAVEVGGRSVRILSVDDEPRNLRILGELFDTAGEHRKVATGTGALECLGAFEPDVALIDIMLPDMDGYRICEFIRNSPRHSFAKVLLVSGKSTIDEKLRGYSVGADDYVTKPFVPEELHAKVAALVRMRELEERLSCMNRELEEQVRVRTQQLVRAEQLAWLGTNTAQVLHNMANPIQIIKAQLLLLEKAGANPRHLAALARNVERLWDTARTILDSTRMSLVALPPADVDLNEVLLEELRLLETNAYFRYGVELSLSLADSPLLVRGPANHFHQILGNLVRNAVEATYSCAEKRLWVSSLLEEGARVVRIRDSGCGISSEQMEKIFDPFFTTKPLVAEGDEPTGTGLGLASVRELLGVYDAEISFDSNPGQGTEVTVVFRRPKEP